MWRRVLPPILIVAVALALQLPRITAPFGPGEINAGLFFGPFTQAWEHFGFAEARGVPFACSPYGDPRASQAYLNHPPGAFWIHALSGSAEWQLRLPGLIASIVAGLLLYGLLKPHLGAVAACSAGLLLQILPVIAVYAQVSYEPLVLAAGLLLYFCFESAFVLRQQWQRRLAKTALLVCAFASIWIDWAALFYVLGLFALVRGRPCADALRLAGLAVAMSVAAVASICVWQLWAVHAPLFGGGRTGGDLGNIVETALLHRPTLWHFVGEATARIGEGFGGWLPFVVLPLCALMLSASVWRILLALAVPAVLNPLLFAGHAEGHVFFFAYAAPVLACLWSGLLLLRARFPWVTVALSALIVAPTLSTTMSGISAATDPWFRDLGREFDRLTVDSSDKHASPMTYRIHTNLPYAFPYYYKSPGIFLGSTKATLDAAIATHDMRCGLRFLWCDLEARDATARRVFPTDPLLKNALQTHGSVSLPVLEHTIPDPQHNLAVQVRSARVFSIIEPPR